MSRGPSTGVSAKAYPGPRRGPGDHGLGGAARATGVWLRASLRDLALNTVLGWPIIALLVALELISAWLFCVDGIARDFGDGLYDAVLALHGSAIADPQHASPLVRVLTTVDWLGGLILLGTFVWLVTTSFEQGRSKSPMRRETTWPGWRVAESNTFETPGEQ